MKSYFREAVLFCAAAVLSFATWTANASDAVEVGKKAPSFTLKDYNNKEHSLDKYLSSKYTVVMFIATQCPISNDYNERMTALHKEFAEKGIAFVGINSNKQESVDEIKQHAADNGFKFDVLKDWNNEIADAYGAQVTPEVYVLDQKATLLYHGRIDDSRDASKIKTHDLKETLNTLLAGKSVEKTKTKAFGCTIKRVKKES